MPWSLRAYSVSPAAHSPLCWLSYCGLCPCLLSSWVSLAMSTLACSCLFPAYMSQISPQWLSGLYNEQSALEMGMVPCVCNPRADR